jgi:hemolysin III
MNMEAKPSVRVKPRFRGVSHQCAFFVSLIAGPALVLGAQDGRAVAATAIYAFSLTALLGSSALYHRITWSARARFWMSRLDLAMIFVLIAGSYTPFALLVLDPPLGSLVLWLVWGAAAAGIVLKLLWTSAAKWATATVYVTMASLGVFVAPEVARVLGTTPVVLLGSGGALYIIGAVIYALERPDPLPAVFGYHEIFHALVIVAATVHYVAVAAYVVPRPM